MSLAELKSLYTGVFYQYSTAPTLTAGVYGYSGTSFHSEGNLLYAVDANNPAFLYRYNINANTLITINKPSGLNFINTTNIISYNNKLYINDISGVHIISDDKNKTDFSTNTYKFTAYGIVSTTNVLSTIAFDVIKLNMYFIYVNGSNVIQNVIYYPISTIDTISSGNTLSIGTQISTLNGLTIQNSYGSVCVNNSYLFIVLSSLSLNRYLINGTTVTSTTSYVSSSGIKPNVYKNYLFTQTGGHSSAFTAFTSSAQTITTSVELALQQITGKTIVSTVSYTGINMFDTGGLYSGYAVDPTTGNYLVLYSGSSAGYSGTSAINSGSPNGTWVANSTITFLAVVPICFKENTQILTINGYKLIQDLRKGDLIKTSKNGYKPIYKIGTDTVLQKSSNKRIKDQLYKCSTDSYPELFEDLVVTGCHCILVDSFKNDQEKQNAMKVNNDEIYITEDKYRLPACVDERTTLYEELGRHNIYHFALENDEYCENYGVYANGLLVESTSKRFMDTTLHEIQ